MFNSLSPGRCGSKLECGIFKLILTIGILTISCGNALRWMAQELVDDNYTPRNEVRGGILDSPCLSVRPSVCLSVR